MPDELIRAWRIVVDKYSGHCVYCFTKCVVKSGLYKHPRYLSIDHKVPRSRGGKNDIRNLVVACKRCNIWKGVKDYREFSKFMKQSIFRKNITLKLRKKAVQLYKTGLSTRKVAAIIGKSHQWVSRVIKHELPAAVR